MKPQNLAVMTIDVEEWFHGVSLDRNTWGSLERRAYKQMDLILEFLSTNNQYATFFVVGDFAQNNTKLIKEIISAGHEVGSHSMFHDSLFTIDETQFESEESKCKSLLEDIIGNRVLGFRAPYFSINQSNMWVYGVLSRLGYSYSSSLSPVKTWRYGVKGLSSGIYKFGKVHEVTPSFGELFGVRFGLGGAYFRLLPFLVTRFGLEKKLKEEMQSPVSFFVHPWELDPNHPRVELHIRARFTHYFNLVSTERKFTMLMGNFNFLSFEKWFRDNEFYPKEF